MKLPLSVMLAEIPFPLTMLLVTTHVDSLEPLFCLLQIPTRLGQFSTPSDAETALYT